MNEEIKGIDEIPIFSWNIEKKEFYVLGQKFDGVNSIEDFINYITNLQEENKNLKQCYCNRTDCGGRIKDSKKYDSVYQENEKLKNFINELISTFNHCELNGTKKLDIVSDYIKQEYENILNGSDEK